MRTYPQIQTVGQAATLRLQFPTGPVGLKHLLFTVAVAGVGLLLQLRMLVVVAVEFWVLAEVLLLEQSGKAERLFLLHKHLEMVMKGMVVQLARGRKLRKAGLHITVVAVAALVKTARVQGLQV